MTPGYFREALVRMARRAGSDQPEDDAQELVARILAAHPSTRRPLAYLNTALRRLIADRHRISAGMHRWTSAPKQIPIEAAVGLAAPSDPRPDYAAALPRHLRRFWRWCVAYYERPFNRPGQGKPGADRVRAQRYIHRLRRELSH